MSTKLKAGTATSGAVIDADTTGILELQSGSTPTTAITVDTSQNVGIGTASPSKQLTVANDASISGLTVGLGAGSNTSNTVLGRSAFGSNTTGSQSIIIGGNAGAANTTGQDNQFIGYYAGRGNTTGNYSVAIGTLALGSASNNAGNNLGIGYYALSATTGGSNTALGSLALQANTTASNNTAVGYQAGYANTTGAYNVYFGQAAGYSATTGTSYSCFIGAQAGQNTTGTQNHFFGQGAGQYVTSGAKNVILGGYGGNAGGLDIRTASNYIVLSDGDGNPRAYWDSTGKLVSTGSSTSTCFTFTNSSATTPSGAAFTFSAAAPNNGTQTFFTTSDTGGYRGGWLSNGGVQNYQANNSNLSDQREKKNIELSGNYLDKICAIPVKTFLFNDQTDTDLNLGVIAQDVQAVAPELIMESNWGTEEEPKMRLSIYQTDLQYALMKAIQEQQALITDLTTRLSALEAK